MRGVCGSTEDDLHRAILLKQVHGKRIAENPSGGEEADGMVVRRGAGFPALRLADCASLFLWSDDWLGAVHAGWRGLAAGAVAALVRSFPGEPVLALSGPCICSGCYEAGEDVRTAVMESCGGIHPPGRLDLAEALRNQAVSAGLRCPILSPGWCTRCRPDLFHSYRRDGTAARNIVILEG